MKRRQDHGIGPELSQSEIRPRGDWASFRDAKWHVTCDEQPSAWHVGLSVSPSSGAPVRRDVVAQPTHDVQLAP